MLKRSALACLLGWLSTLGGNAFFWLHVEKVETHSPESLNKRNGELDRFASAFPSVEYDGMDVGPSAGPSELYGEP